MVRKWLTLSIKWLWKKSTKNKKQNKNEKIWRNESETNFMDLLETTFSIQCFLNLNLFFSFLGSLLSRNRCKLRRKLRNAPLRSKFQIFMKFQFRLVLSFFLFFILSFQKHIAFVYFLKSNWGYTFLKALNEKQKNYKTNLNWSY